jgi:uncharacterized protein YdcH (DUF465 family)
MFCKFLSALFTASPSDNLVFKCEKDTSKHSQQDAEDLQETKLLVKDEIVEGRYDNERAMDDAV